jgi:hypothetical protein
MNEEEEEEEIKPSNKLSFGSALGRQPRGGR